MSNRRQNDSRRVARPASRPRSAAPPSFPWPLLAALGIVVAAVFVVFQPSVRRGAQAAVPVTFTNGPRVIFDQTEIDLGEVPFDRTVERDFTFSNVGNAPLTITRRPEVSTVEGC